MTNGANNDGIEQPEIETQQEMETEVTTTNE